MSARRAEGGASTFTKGLRVLACFEGRERSHTMAELARRSGMDRATVRRLCLSLVESGYLSRDGRAFSLTPRILAVAGGYLGARDIGLSVQPVLNEFADRLALDISLSVQDGDRAIYVARSALRTERSSIGLTVGSTLPLLHSSVGRMILGSLPTPEAEAIIARVEPVAHTPLTVLDRAVISDRVARARAGGVCHVDGEFEPGAAGVSVALGRLSGQVAVLGCTNSSNAFAEPAERDRVTDILRRAALSLRGLAAFN